MGGFNVFYDSVGLVNRDGILTIDAGWVRLEGAVASLPLGGFEHQPTATDYPGEPAGGVPAPAWDADLPITTAGYEQPVVLIAEMFRSDGQGDQLNIFAATSVTETPIAPAVGPPIVHGTSDIGFCWYFDVGGAEWLNVPFDDSVPVPYVNPVGGMPIPLPIAGKRDEMFDWAPYPLGGTPVAPSTTNPGLIVFTNKIDEVYAWDIGNDPGAAPDNQGSYTSAYGGELDDTFFKAKSVELYDDRLVFLNTEEDGENHFRRVRWTALSLIDDGATPPIAVAPRTPSLTNVGSGFIDLNEFNGEGLRVLKFEDRAALYFTDGVALLERTWNPTNPFNRQYLTKERGLLGTFAVTRISGDAHFGIFTDGWYYLLANGQWVEAGTLKGEGISARKWAHTFYQLINDDRANEIVVSFDSYYHYVRISFPSGEDESTTWIYDTKTDTVWPDDPYEAVIWGSGNSLLQASVVWGAAVGTWGTFTGRWMDLDATYGDKVPLHGTDDGVIFLHSPTATQRDGEDVSWSFLTHLQDYNDPYSKKTGDRIAINHITSIVDSSVAIGFRNEEGTQVTNSFNLNVDETGATAVSAIHAVVTGDSLAITGAGFGPVEFYSFQPSIRATFSPAKDLG